MLRALCALSLSTLLLSSCGSHDTFAGQSGKPPVKQGTTNVVAGPHMVSGLTWFWQCGSDPADVPKAQGDEVVIVDGGVHEFSDDAFKQVPVTITGRVCPPAKFPRDIVFVIDVSGSMGKSANGNPPSDPAVGGSCGRLAAVQSIINSVVASGSDARFGIVTFSSQAQRYSNAMYGDATNLMADIAPGSSPFNVLCAAAGGTNYTAGLEKAKAIFEHSRPDAVKELYFVSDGVPDPANDPTVDGSTVAPGLKSPGVSVEGKSIPVTIATVMLGGADASILQKIASVGRDGAPLHKTTGEASKLGEALGALAANDIAEGTIKYRPTGTDVWTTIDLKTNLQGYNFSIPSFTLDKNSAPNGLEVAFEYRDLKNNVHASGGDIKWALKKTK